MNFKNKRVLITGGTGSLGQGLLRRIKGAKKITILSRSEFGQTPLRLEYPEVEFILGDIRDLSSVQKAVKNQDIVIHAAAFKFLDLAEKQPMECVKTNILGSINLIEAVKQSSVEICLGISTDKVTNARNVYGCTKHIMEKLFREANSQSKTKFLCVRYGNVMGTTGSVFTIWEKQFKEGKALTVTDVRMTRFFFSVDEAIDLIFYALKNGKGGEVFTVTMPGFNIHELAKERSKNIKIIGLRPGEKLHETLIADYEGKEYNSNKTIKEKRYLVI